MAVLSSVLMIVAAALSAAATGVDTGRSAVADLVDVSNNFCYRLAAQEFAMGGSVGDDQKIIAAHGLAYGIDNTVLDRLGPEGSGLVSQAVMGNRTRGRDTIVLAVGGQVPGCKTMLLGAATDNIADKTARALMESALGWKEAPATNQPGSPLQRRMFVRRDSKGQPYLLNMFAVNIPGSEIRLLTTVNPIPPQVTLPEGL